MADGVSRPVEEVRAGDYVLGMTGRANRVIGTRAPVLGSRSLYSFNGGTPFVTASHPFLTEEGWKSLDPAATARFMPDQAVGQLRAGDRIRALAGVLVAAGPAAVEDVAIESTLIERIDASGETDPRTPIYTLVLDGDHTYFANDLIVHNKL